jgi:thioredoxin
MSDLVKELDSASFQQAVKEPPCCVVDFFAEWCPHCKNLEPAFKEAAESMKERAHFARLDTDAQESVASQYNVHALPTIMVFVDGRPVARREGEMSAQGIEDLVKGTFASNRFLDHPRHPHNLEKAAVKKPPLREDAHSGDGPGIPSEV